jgi:hypothetical protein
MRLGFEAMWGEPGSMSRCVRAQGPLPRDSVDTYGVYRQGTVGLDVQTDEVLEVLVVLGSVPLGLVKAKAVGGPEITRQPHHCADATHHADQAEEGDQGPHAAKP